jgi:dihydrolipoamide dehydrogenase
MDYDIIVLGSGPGGYVAAIKAAQLGAKVAIVEKNDIGGVCLNIGCIPTKALLSSAKVYRDFLNAEKFGIKANNIDVDWKSVISRKNQIVQRLTKGVKFLLQKNKVDIISGYGKIINKNTIDVEGKKISSKNIIIATGASPIIPPIPGVKEAIEKNIIVTSKEILDLDKLPNSLVIIGGGVIGVEFATIFATFGAKVTIIERENNILLNVDDEIRKEFLKLLHKNITVLTKSEVVKVENNKVTYKTDNANHTTEADKILMSVGMKPNLNFSDTLNLETTKAGIKVNKQMETNIKGIYAIGDVNGQMMLAHVASREGIVAVHNILGKKDEIDYQKIPSGIYGFPEIAMVGMTEESVKKENIPYKVSKFPIAANGKALAEGESDGFIKIITESKYGEILGIHILGNHATELISEGVVTMELEGTVYELAKSVHPHPTISEIINEAAHGAVDKPIHI